MYGQYYHGMQRINESYQGDPWDIHGYGLGNHGMGSFWTWLMPGLQEPKSSTSSSSSDWGDDWGTLSEEAYKKDILSRYSADTTQKQLPMPGVSDEDLTLGVLETEYTGPGGLLESKEPGSWWESALSSVFKTGSSYVEKQMAAKVAEEAADRQKEIEAMRQKNLELAFAHKKMMEDKGFMKKAEKVALPAAILGVGAIIALKLL